MYHAVANQPLDLLLLESLDLRSERLEQQVDEVHQGTGAHMLGQTKRADVATKLRGSLVGVADRPEVQRESACGQPLSAIEIATRCAVWSAKRRTV
jgi:hypothetical protein